MKTVLLVTTLFAAFAIIWITNTGKTMAATDEKNPSLQDEKPTGAPYAIFAGGCFWCMEWEFNTVYGVLYTESGYTGGHVANPTYRDVTSGKSGHAEANKIYYDPTKTDYRKLVDYFLRKAHDPTTLNRQGVDIGPQYRSAIFYVDAEQKRTAEEAIAEAEAGKVWPKRIVTKLEPEAIFYPAEEYHQDYYEKYKVLNGQDHIRVQLKKRKKGYE